jgi:hypothetical protein
MPNIVTNQLKISNSKNFIESISDESGNYLYLFLGKPNPWSGEDVPPPEDIYGTYSRIWDEMVSMKRILPTNVINVVKRIDWFLGDTYTEYDNEDADLLSKPFYVLTKDFSVYKCISNNNGAVSLVEPTGTNIDIMTLSDGYKWKYLYTISTGDQLKFLTAYWMPVIKDLIVSANAKDGAIEYIKINNSGLDYSEFANVKVIGDGSGAIIKPKINLGVIYDFIYTDTGTGYRYANAYISDYAGSSGKYADLRAIINPPGGHGYDPVYELGAKYLMINVRNDYIEGYPTFRQLGIVKNPISTTGFKASAATLNTLNGIRVGNVVGTFAKDEFVLGKTSLANAYVAYYISNVTSTIRFVQSFGVTDNFSKFKEGENVIGSVSGATATVSNLLYSDVLPNRGDVFYIENRSPITRSSNQTDNLHLVIEF